MYNHVIYTKVTGVYFLTTFILAGEKVPVVFVHELSSLMCIYYQAIYNEVIVGIFFNNFYLGVELYRGVCT